MAVTVEKAVESKGKASKGKGKVKGKSEAVKPAGTKAVKNKYGVPVETKVSGAEDGRFASVKIMGYPLAQILRSLGRAGLKAAQVRVVMDQIGLTAVRSNTIADKVNEGRNGDKSVTYAPLSKKELAKLTQLAPKAE